MKAKAKASQYFMGIDFGTSGARVAIIDSGKELIYTEQEKYFTGLEQPKDWQDCFKKLIANLPVNIKNNLCACSLDATSGTILACDHIGNPLSNALPYHFNYEESKEALNKLIRNNNINLARR